MVKQKISPYPIKSSLSKFIKQGSISGSIWRAQEIISLSNSILNPPVLDLGCGDGSFVKLVFNGKLDFGLDLSSSKISKAKQIKAYKNYIIADAHKIPLSTNSINTVFSNSVFEHIPNLDGVIYEISRVLKPGGELIFTTHSPQSKKFYFSSFLRGFGLNLLANYYENIFTKMLQLRTLWTIKKWERILARAGLKVTKKKLLVSERNGFWYEILMPLTFIQNRFSIFKKIGLTNLLFKLIKPDFGQNVKNARDYFIRAKKFG